ncbi:hypothetical protein [Wenjunlia tyrosinilytica]|uniref:Uncharacterized protein n=1 Tax=Wenjunlia tyrosinilytica TaxID=1544741 RepID=A0A918E0U8_9ACTN|nr:hypothetical protein [Wenjunlia tyrosinilytica]GGO99656.1 hypothetical protein GCM10012280_66600 [Wenjunlia tyrosinilytica]
MDSRRAHLWRAAAWRPLVAGVLCVLLGPGAASAADGSPLAGELLTSSDTIDSGHPVDLVLSVQNRQSVPVSLQKVDVLASDGLRACAWRQTACDAHFASRPAPVRSVAAGDTATLRYRLRSQGRLWPGPKLVVVSVHGRYVLKGKPHQVSLTLSKRVQFAVLGEAQFISGIGVPSFLLLPGFLLLATYRLLARRSRQGEAALPQLDVNAMEFVALSASLSIAAVPLFWVISWFAGEPRTYLDGYDTQDLLAVWIGSIAAGAVAFSVPAALAAIQLWLRTPQLTDSPGQALSRLARAGEGLTRTQMRFRHAGPGGEVPAQAFVYAAPAVEGDPYWLMPPIRYTCRAGAAPDVHRRLVELLRGEAPAKAVHDFLRQHAKDVDLSWAPGALRGPVQVSAPQVRGEVAAAPLLRMEAP